MPPPPTIVQPVGHHRKTMFFFHGLGDASQNWSTVIDRACPPHLKMIFPIAPTIQVTLNGNFSMPAWFDIYALTDDADEDSHGIHRAAREVKQMIETEIANTGIQSQNIVLGGFSQGGALALYTALTCDIPLGGVVALSTWLPLRHEFPANLSLVNKSIHVFQGHGTMDPIVPLRWGEATHTFLKRMGVTNCTFRKYTSLMHSSCDEEIRDVGNFLNEIFK